MDVKGQGALEYLLLIGGAVLVAAIVIALITGIPTTTPNPAAVTRCASHSLFAVCEADCDFSEGGITWDCKAMQADGVNDATVQANMAMCSAFQSAAAGCP